MADPNHRIKLDYKRPEKGDRSAAWEVTRRAIAGLIGTFGMLGLLWFVAHVFNTWTDLITMPIGGRIVTVLCGLLAMLILVPFVICLMKYAIIGDRKSSDPTIESDE